MLHACVQRYDVTENLKKFYKNLETKQSPTLAADDEDLVPWNSRKPRTVRVDQSCRILAAALHCMQAEEYSYMRAFFFFNTSDRLFFISLKACATRSLYFM